jgi:Homeodomain
VSLSCDGMNRSAAGVAKNGRSGSVRCSLTESLEQLAAASQKLADIAAEVLGVEDDELARDTKGFEPYIKAAQTMLLEKFHPRYIEGYDGSDGMEKARIAHLEAAVEMYTVLVETSDTWDSDLASRIGDSLFKELMEYYRTMQHANERVIFTTEQRTALESAFLLKPKLNTAEKRALAKTCNLNPRQVEVWVRAVSLSFVYRG